MTKLLTTNSNLPTTNRRLYKTKERIPLSLSQELMVDTTYLEPVLKGMTPEEKAIYETQVSIAAKAVDQIRQTGKGPDGSDVLFTHLPYLLQENVLITDEEKERLLALQEKAKYYDVVISIGIGGSYLGNQVLFDLFCGTSWNKKSKEERNGYPQIYFAGQNIDPIRLERLAETVKRESEKVWWKQKVLLLVISKSGTTIEPMSAAKTLQVLLQDCNEVQIMAITDKEKGILRQKAKEYHYDCFTVPEGIGGRFSVFSPVGLVFAQMAGIDIQSFLAGAQMIEEACQSDQVETNLALRLASLKYWATKKSGIETEIIMPYGELLRTTGWWYCQLLGESLGKKYDNQGKEVYYGRTPVPALGTTDMHSLTQEHQQGKKNKLVQFLTVQHLSHDVDVPCEEGNISGTIPMSLMLDFARKANAQALASEGRLSCTITVKKITPFHVGALLYFFFLCIAYEGAMADINAYDQPGVEAYKKILHEDLRCYLLEHNK